MTAQRGWFDELRKPGTTDDARQGEQVTVRANQVSSVRIVVEAQSGAIRGTVIDAGGKPVTDAYVSAARESDAAGARQTSVSDTRWSWDGKPILTSTEGTFTVTKLSPGNYTLRAYRQGGGEAIAEHVAVGSSVKLQIKATGSIEGTARRAGPPVDELTAVLFDPAIGLRREERFFGTGGRFAIRDLPKGRFRITIETPGGHGQVDVELGEGERRTGVDVELTELVTLTGRVVELGTTRPVPRIRMSAQPVGGAGGGVMRFDEAGDFITDDAGRFTLRNTPRGKLSIRGRPRDFPDGEYSWLTAVRVIEGTGTIDLGDLAIARNRVKQGEPVGEHGIRFVRLGPETPPDKGELKVSFIDPAGPAAKTELKVGDVITTIDGVDVTGAGLTHAGTLMRAPPGTRLVFGLARGATVTVILAPP